MFRRYAVGQTDSTETTNPSTRVKETIPTQFQDTLRVTYQAVGTDWSAEAAFRKVPDRGPKDTNLSINKTKSAKARAKIAKGDVSKFPRVRIHSGRPLFSRRVDWVGDTNHERCYWGLPSNPLSDLPGHFRSVETLHNLVRVSTRNPSSPLDGLVEFRSSPFAVVPLLSR